MEPSSTFFQGLNHIRGPGGHTLRGFGLAPSFATKATATIDDSGWSSSLTLRGLSHEPILYQQRLRPPSTAVVATPHEDSVFAPSFAFNSYGHPIHCTAQVATPPLLRLHSTSLYLRPWLAVASSLLLSPSPYTQQLHPHPSLQPWRPTPPHLPILISSLSSTLNGYGHCRALAPNSPFLIVRMHTTATAISPCRGCGSYIFPLHFAARPATETHLYVGAGYEASTCVGESSGLDSFPSPPSSAHNGYGQLALP